MKDVLNFRLVRPYTPPMHDALTRLLEEVEALRTGHFLLTSGNHSPYYLEKFRILERPDLLARFVQASLARLRALRPTVVVGPTTGGVLVAYEVARQLQIRAYYAERRLEGGRELRRGFRFSVEDRVLLADDILTTGTSLQETREAVERLGGKVVGAFVLIRRGDPHAFTWPVVSSLELDLPIYTPDACPQCREGQPLERPGKGST